MLSVLVTGGLLFALFQYIPLQDLGIRFRLGAPELIGTLAIVLPLCPLIVAHPDVRRDVREVVQGSAELLELPDDGADGAGHDGDDEPRCRRKAWMYYVPWIGQQTLLTDVLGNKPISPLVFVVVGVVNIALAVVVAASNGRTAPPRENYLRTVRNPGLEASWLPFYFTLTTMCADVQQH